MEPRLRLALLLSLVLHGALVASTRYRLSFDAYIHMFFADHYRRTWWELTEPRWYTGFSVTSYPPLVHQVIAMLSLGIGIEAAWAVFLFSNLMLIPPSVYAFSRLFVGKRSSGYAALASAVLPSVALTAHTFGQGPTLAGLVATLWALTSLGIYLRRGHPGSTILAVALIGVVAASHHGTLLLLPFGATTVGVHYLLAHRARLVPGFRRLGLFASASMVTVFIVIWPFWLWGATQTMQTPIDHGSRHNLLFDSGAELYFWPMYGPFILAAPWVLGGLLRRKRCGLALFFIWLFVLGLGGTTPLPRWLFGPAWEWLTYDRFALWASVMMLPSVGQLTVVVERTMHHCARRTWTYGRSMVLASAAIVACTAGLLPTLSTFQPPAVEMGPIVGFLDDPKHAGWRYLTLGFGDQLARLSMLTDATTLDGNYHTARQLPELRSSGIGQIDTAYWSVPGLPALDPILDRASYHGARWGFVLPPHPSEPLERHGWIRGPTLSNGVQVWENPVATGPLPPNPVLPVDWITAGSWGILPFGTLVQAIWWAWIMTRRGEWRYAFERPTKGTT